MNEQQRGRTPTGLEVRVSALEHDVARLTELVDGQQTWSHRKRLHMIENDDRGVTIAAEALKAYRDQKMSVRTQVREWGAFVLAIVAVLVASHPWS